MKTQLKRLNNFYTDYILNHPEGGGWKSIEDAQEVYKASTLSNIIPWGQIGSVLDIGSAAGNFLSFLRKDVNYLKSYTGIEAIDFFYDKSIKTWNNDTKASFINSDFLEYNFPDKKYDWIFCIGTLGTKNANKKEYDTMFIEKICGLSAKGATLYVNNKKYFNKERLKQIKDLYAHDIPFLIQQLSKYRDFNAIHISHYPENAFANCAINILFQ